MLCLGEENTGISAEVEIWVFMKGCEGIGKYQVGTHRCPPSTRGTRLTFKVIVEMKLSFLSIVAILVATAHGSVLQLAPNSERLVCCSVCEVSNKPAGECCVPLLDGEARR